MLQPLMGNNDLVVRLQLALNPTCLPIPEHYVPFRIAAAYPLPIRREADLTRISCYGVARKSLLTVLAEGVGVVEENLVIE